MSTSDDILSAWIEVERVLELLPVGHPYREAVRRAANALDEAYHDDTLEPRLGLEALSHETIRRSVALARRLRSEGVVNLDEDTLGVLTDIDDYLTRPPLKLQPDPDLRTTSPRAV